MWVSPSFTGVPRCHRLTLCSNMYERHETGDRINLSDTSTQKIRRFIWAANGLANQKATVTKRKGVGFEQARGRALGKVNANAAPLGSRPLTAGLGPGHGSPGHRSALLGTGRLLLFGRASRRLSGECPSVFGRSCRPRRSVGARGGTMGLCTPAPSAGRTAAGGAAPRSAGAAGLSALWLTRPSRRTLPRLR